MYEDDLIDLLNRDQFTYSSQAGVPGICLFLSMHMYLWSG
jgi:hypothetical protein